jgi:intein/homing endonuclease
VYYTGDQECYRITLTSGHSIEVSHGHEMWVDDGKNGVKIQAKDLKVGDRIPVLQPNEGHFGDDNFSELAGLMGNLLGDDPLTGSVISSSHRLKEIFTNEFGLSTQPKRVPKRIWSADKQTVFAFLRGLYTASGRFKKDSIVLYQDDLEFLREIQLLLSMSGFTSIISNNTDTNKQQAWALSISDADLILRFSQETGIRVPDQQAKLDDVKGKNQSSWQFAEVEKIENIGVKPTYCLTEPLLNTVTVNGIVTGQCRCSLSFLAPGFGFKAGRVAWIGDGHDEYKAQRGQQ